jgi:hypothetical protein
LLQRQELPNPKRHRDEQAVAFSEEIVPSPPMIVTPERMATRTGGGGSLVFSVSEPSSRNPLTTAIFAVGSNSSSTVV